MDPWDQILNGQFKRSREAKKKKLYLNFFNF